ncbi:linear amide C-N hydrolase [Shewanella sp. Scap07]|uniref:linear amide C-N hydrolase n=1 Tax=Shewanella sp. Scap07 TaxID=2589987 RepID=UPI0015B7BD77|nr:linear amide C-N hydrolase [Shewanella sp. Scap07]QLE86601.1 linear amide C-N hydrolase [Shewanella sp. Scap07]
MKNANLKKISALVIALASVAGLSQAQACSRITLDTPHGVSTVRSLDWGTQLGNISQVNPVGIERSTQAPSYKRAMQWTTKYHSIAQMEWDVFHGVASDAINSQGLGTSLLYMADSAPYIKDYKDTGAPAVSFLDLVSYINETYANVDEVVNAFEANEFQVAWADGLHGVQHGLHFSVHDKSGDIALFQLNEGGKVVVHRGDVQSDMRVMANAPLQQHHREYVNQVDLNNLEAKSVPSSISSLDRNLRGLFNTSHVKFDDNKSWAQTRGKLLSTYNAGNLVPQDLIDPVNGETYATWTQFVYNHQNGDFLLTDYDTRMQIGYNFNDTLSFTETRCANTLEQANAGETQVTWGTCK